MVGSAVGSKTLKTGPACSHVSSLSCFCIHPLHAGLNVIRDLNILEDSMLIHSHALETARSNELVSRVMHVGALGMGAGTDRTARSRDGDCRGQGRGM